MGKLSSLPPSLGAAPARLSRPSGEDRHAASREPWRAWYWSKEWKQLKEQAHQRDGYLCQRTRVLCAGKGNDWNAPVANHKVPHRGNRELFFDLNNIETVTKRYHDSVIQAEEARYRAEGRDIAR